eukprot:TRINITY_DN8819_c0_g1_i1.p1 TRINITY_DN8819_c0_g1~~TRINITY_DN8819_c0_g1_i1.p1  ORF type:complete len:733 (+),score=161.82 TRINITY_DN8819_c0_g1_i1:194-2392(+)
MLESELETETEMESEKGIIASVASVVGDVPSVLKVNLTNATHDVSPRSQKAPAGLITATSTKRVSKKIGSEDELNELRSYLDVSDLDKIAVKMKGGMFGKKNRLKLLPIQEVGTLGQHSAKAFSDAGLRLILHVLSMMEMFQTPNVAISKVKKPVLDHFIKQLNSSMMDVVAIINQASPDESSGLYKLIMKATDVLSSQMEAKIHPVDPKLLNTGQFPKFIQHHILLSLHRQVNTLFFTTSQVITDLSVLTLQEDSLLLHFIALLLTSSELIKGIKNDIETLFFLRDYQLENTYPREPKLVDRNEWEMMKSVWDFECPTAEMAFEPSFLAELIVRWTPSKSFPPTEEFSSTLLTTWTQFASTESLVEHLLDRWSCPSEKVDQALLPLIRLRVLKALIGWLDSSYFMIDDRVREMLLNFLLNAQNESASSQGKQLVSTMETTLKEIETKYYTIPPSLLLINRESIPAWEGTILPHCTVLKFDEKVVAEQLTLIESEIFKNIKSHELLGQAWSQDKLKCISRNVVELLQRANYVSFWVAISILLQNRLHNRISVITKFITIAQHLKDLNNYNTLMGIIAGLNYGPVSRLKHSFAGVKKNKQILQDLQEFVNPSGSYKRLRDLTESVSGKSVVPYIGITLQDLTFIDENKDFVEAKGMERVPDGTKLINFAKQRMVHLAIYKLLRHQVTCNFSTTISRAEPIFTFLYSLPKLPNDALYTLSHELEPRGGDLKNIV